MRALPVSVEVLGHSAAVISRIHSRNTHILETAAAGVGRQHGRDRGRANARGGSSDHKPPCLYYTGGERRGEGELDFFFFLSRNGNRQNNGRETMAASERDMKG